MKKLIVILLLLSAVAFAANTKTTDLPATTDIQGTDIFYIVDGGTSSQITALNLFDIIDTFLKLDTIVADESLVNKADAVTWDSLGTFSAGINLGTSQSLVGTTAMTFGNNGQTIAIDSSDWDIGVTGIMTGIGNITSDGDITAGSLFVIGAASMSETDLEQLDGITAGTAAASKALVLDASLDIGTINILTATSFVGTLTGNADTVTTNANLTGEVTSVGNTATIVQSFLEDGGASEIAVTAGMMNTGTLASGTTFWRGDNTWATPAGAGDLLADGSVSLTADWDAGNSLYDITAVEFKGDLIGNADTVTNATLTTALTVNTGTLTLTADAGNDSVLTIGGGASSFSGTSSGTNTGGNTGDNTVATSGDSATAFFDAGTIEHEWGGLQLDISTFTGLIGISGANTTVEVDAKSELEALIADVSDFAEADGDVYTNNHDFGGADLELPQASPAAPDVDGEVEVDFTDGSLVVQMGSAHTELAASTDIVIGKMIRSFAATFIAPDAVNDVIPMKPITATEFPHGIVITEVHMVVGTDSNYTIDVENWDDFDTINGANPSINSTAYTNGNDGEVTDSTITYATIAAGQIIMLDIPATDIDWVNITVFYYEPTS